MEKFIHYVWKHRLFPLNELRTTNGELIEVIDVGLYNRNNGPDFFNAKIKIGGTLWVGNVEIHERSSDWFRHNHHTDACYNNVILHVASEIDTDIQTALGNQLPQLKLEVPDYVRRNYEELITNDEYPPCHKIISTLPEIMMHSWLNALQIERLEQRTQIIERRLEVCNGDWESVYFITLARNFGFGINGDAFEEWGKRISLHNLAYHRDNLVQIEAIFMGQAGLLDIGAVHERNRAAALKDEYFLLLQSEYCNFSHRFNLSPMDASHWHFLRLRPQNFPHIRISQLAYLYAKGGTGLQTLIECKTIDEVIELLDTRVTTYWQTHYSFGAPSRTNIKQLSLTSRRLMIVNTVAPMFFAYGRFDGNDKLAERAMDFLESIGAEDNRIVRMWRELGINIRSAADSQALIQLKNEYCDRKDCLRCRIGYKYLASPK